MNPLPAVLLLLFPAAQAHEVLGEVSRQMATVVTLTYADGTPLARTDYELYLGDGRKPLLVGRTDPAGRVAFVPDQLGPWRLRAFTEDGHGIDTRFETEPSPTARPAGGEGLTLVRSLLGAALILALFGLYQLFLRRRR